MTKLAATLCLILFALLGSAGVSWGAEIQNDDIFNFDNKALKCRLNYRDKIQYWKFDKKFISIVYVVDMEVSNQTAKAVGIKTNIYFKKFHKDPIQFGKKEKYYLNENKIYWGKGIFGNELNLYTFRISDLTRRKKDLGKCELTTQDIIFSELITLRNAFIPDMNIVRQAAREKNFELARMHLEPLVYRGDTKAQAYLGTFYHFGWGVKKNYSIARSLYQMAVKTNDIVAMSGLGDLYEQGHGVIQDFETAAKFYRSAAEQGNPYAQTQLGLKYYDGTGLLKDKIYAHMWVNIAASLGSNRAVRIRRAIAEKMNISQIKKAQKLARECVQKKYKGC